MFLDIVIDFTKEKAMKFVTKHQSSNSVDITEIFVPKEYGRALYISNNTVVLYDMINH